MKGYFGGKKLGRRLKIFVSKAVRCGGLEVSFGFFL